MSNPKEEPAAGFIVPDPSQMREDIPGDAGDEANAIRFSEEQALIEEQAHGLRPDTYSVPSGGPTMDEARGNMDLSDRSDSGGAPGPEDDSSDDGLHGGAES
ncbi:hypothetical protein [Arthrobacter bambusae]|uniref:hypothetical protein n=1 Tax=Arthrobacter bambusae TaxID=1338426 RepID=UPI002788F2C7|nr:hypothetical protein [Arthrobacter bambusae]MDQ0028251.1 hypothetical protein [Arthrobacter bambusae]MDQ0096955.1 hypothetical protein [Arthrobacter bambusae]